MKKDLKWQIQAATTYMRIDAADHIRQLNLTCNYALVTDVDILFLQDPRPILEKLKPTRFCACPEEPFEKFSLWKSDKNYFNNGIVWINIDFMCKILPSLREYILSRNFDIPGPLDQAALNTYCQNHFQNFQLEQLPEAFNWKAYWGNNPDAMIVHFHGPKPDHFEKYLQWYKDTANPTMTPARQVAKTFSWPDNFGESFILLMRFSQPKDLQDMVTLFHQFD